MPQPTEITQFIFGQPLSLTASVIGDSRHLADRGIAAGASRQGPGEGDNEALSHRGDRVWNVPLGSYARRLWVDNLRERQIPRAARRNLVLRGEGRSRHPSAPRPRAGLLLGLP